MTATTDLSWDDIKAMIAELAQQGRETDRRMQETDRTLRSAVFVQLALLLSP